ncbi:MAG: putative Protein TonB [Nitrospira sp.]|nr:putative Protein TonB [Nitrospira sp.]
MKFHEDTATKLCGWMLSLLLHGVSVGTAIVLAADFSLVPREKPFQWNVSMITTLSPEAIVSDLPSAAAADAPPHMTTTTDSAVPGDPMMDSQKSLGTGDSTAARPFNRLTHTLSRPDQSDRDALHEDHLKSEGKSRADTAPPNQPVTQTIGPAASSGAFPVSSPASAALPATDVKSLQRSVLASEPSIQKVNRVIHRPPSSPAFAISRPDRVTSVSSRLWMAGRHAAYESRNTQTISIRRKKQSLARKRGASGGHP